VFFNPSLGAALDRISERAADVRRAFTPGAVPEYDDVATPAVVSDFALDPLSVVPPEGVFFVTGDAQGRVAYTRDGSFTLRSGKLTDATGDAILGQRVANGPLVELAVDAVDASLGRIHGIGIDRDGTLVYRREIVDPRSGARESQRVVIGRLAVARFPAGTRVETSDGSRSLPPDGVIPQKGFAGDGNFAPLEPMRRERSRIDVNESLARLKDAYLAFDALQAAEAAKAHFGKTAMDLLK
jgi:flagellar basal body rod protein FlgG